MATTTTRTRRRTLSPELVELDDERETVDGQGEDECLFCTLIEEADEETDDGEDEQDVLREKLSTALAYGALVFAPGHGVATCDACNEAIELALRGVRKEMRDLKRQSRSSARAGR